MAKILKCPACGGSEITVRADAVLYYRPVPREGAPDGVDLMLLENGEPYDYRVSCDGCDEESEGESFMAPFLVEEEAPDVEGA